MWARHLGGGGAGDQADSIAMGGWPPLPGARGTVRLVDEGTRRGPLAPGHAGRVLGRALGARFRGLERTTLLAALRKKAQAYLSA